MTNDDAITVVTQPIILNITNRHTNQNGCGMPATWFVPVANTDPALVQQVYVKGHEIATHTVNHVASASIDEIVAAKVWMNQTAKLPMEKVQGFRAPYLAFSPEQRAILASNGFRYDSSISESYPSSTSPNSSYMLWPYTMDYGIPQDCAISTGVCYSNESYPGFWEFPLWNTQDASGDVVASMDPQGDQYELYKEALNARLAGNRAPLGIYLHAAWLIADPDHADQLNRFFEYALAQPNTWLVTIQQVLDWQQNPVPASKYAPSCPSAVSLLAELAGAEICVAPNTGCNFGTWNNKTCVCDCQGEQTTAGGYCKDDAGSCTVAKSFDFNTNQYVCTGAAVAPTAPTPTAAPTSPSLQLSEADCDHPLLNYTGLAISGYSVLSDAYTTALKAVDGSCATCALASVSGSTSYLTINLSYDAQLTGVSILSAYDVLVDVHVGDSSSNSGLDNALCTESFKVTAGSATLVPCTGSGSVITVSTQGTLTLCDVYPITTGTPSPPPPVARTSVTISLTVQGLSVDTVTSTAAPAICAVLVGMTGDDGATCTVSDVASSASRRRLLASGDVRVTVVVNTVNPEALLAALAQPSQVAAQMLTSASVSVDPDTIVLGGDASPLASPPSSPNSNPTSSPDSGNAGSSPVSDDGGSKSNAGAIAGGVIGGLAGAALLAWGFVLYRRRAAANASGLPKAPKEQRQERRRGPAINNYNPAYGATATLEATATKGEVSQSPLRDFAKSMEAASLSALRDNPESEAVPVGPSPPGGSPRV